MKTVTLHDWGVSTAEAKAIQEELRSQVVTTGRPKGVKTVAGADVAFDKKAGKAFACVLVYSFPELVELERREAVVPLSFPYVPGLLTFREGPALLAAFRKVRRAPDVIMFDGHGLAHPRRIGIASHMGLLLDRPTIGCAKSRYIGEHDEPGPTSGEWSPLLDHGEIIGRVVRTRDGVKPIFVSIGHMISVHAAMEITLKCVDRYRIPKPTREADIGVGKLKRTYLAKEVIRK